jgi:hypothetical protein
VNDEQRAALAASPARTLLHTVREYLDEHAPLWRDFPGSLPRGLRLEMHPSVRSAVLHELGLEWPPEPGAAESAFGVPVKVTTDLPEGGWRLVVVTEDVLTGGKMP